MTDGSVTGRDRVWAIALEVGRHFRDRGYLREFSPETVVEVVEERELDVSSRTVRRVLDAMVATGALEDVSDGDLRLYRLPAISGDEDVDTSVEEATSPLSPVDSDEVLIAHLFADWGVESEPLSAYGRVVRIGWDPSPNPSSDVIKADALEPPLRSVFDLAVCHPYCQPWSTLTRASGDPDSYPKQISGAREIAREIAEDYVIENVPPAISDPDEGLIDPDGGSLVTLSGRMFGLPGAPFRRAFETSFPVPQPSEQAILDDPGSPFAAEDGTLGDWRGSKRLWRTLKQVSGEYPAEAIKNNGIPAPYVHFLAYWWLRSRPELIETPWSSDMAPSSREASMTCTDGGRS